MGFKFLLLPLSWLYAGLAAAKNFFYDRGLLDGVRVDKKVISVGNLTMGGTGKTPIVDLILTYLESKNISVALISKNYKAEVKHTVSVDLTHAHGARHFGDEAWMLAKKHLTTQVFVGPKKWYTLWLAAKTTSATVCVVDDGFQHRQLQRDLDIVILDAMAPDGEYELLPLGRARESWLGLNRAQIVVLTKTNWALPEHLEKLRAKVRWQSSSAKVVEAVSKLDLTDCAGKKVMAFAGVGQPEQFKKMLEGSMDIQLIEFIAFRDHQKYGPAEIQKIKSAAAMAEIIVTTEKDFSKLDPADFSIPLKALSLHTEITLGASEFYATLDSCIC